MKEQNVLIFGDSYSTFLGSVPAGHSVYYTGHREAGPDIFSADESWWGMLAKETGATILRNDSASGSTIGYTAYSGNDTSLTTSFICRLEGLMQEGYFAKNRIDRVYVFGGTNDSWSNAPLGEEMSEGFTRKDLYSVLPAIGYFFRKLREALPSAEIVGICNCGIKPEVICAIANACTAVGGRTVRLEGIDKLAAHPTARGMVEIKDQIRAALGE